MIRTDRSSRTPRERGHATRKGSRVTLSLSLSLLIGCGDTLAPSTNAATTAALVEQASAPVASDSTGRPAVYSEFDLALGAGGSQRVVLETGMHASARSRGTEEVSLRLGDGKAYRLRTSYDQTGAPTHEEVIAPNGRSLRIRKEWRRAGDQLHLTAMTLEGPRVSARLEIDDRGVRLLNRQDRRWVDVGRGALVRTIENASRAPVPCRDARAASREGTAWFGSTMASEEEADDPCSKEYMELRMGEVDYRQSLASGSALCATGLGMAAVTAVSAAGGTAATLGTGGVAAPVAVTITTAGWLGTVSGFLGCAALLQNARTQALWNELRRNDLKNCLQKHARPWKRETEGEETVAIDDPKVGAGGGGPGRVFEALTCYYSYHWERVGDEIIISNVVFLGCW